MLKRSFALAIALACIASAQRPAPSTPRTTVVDTLLDYSCQNFVGSIRATLNSSEYSFSLAVSVVAGKFNLSMYPGTYSVVISSSTFNIDRYESWTVAQSTPALTLANVGSPSANIVCAEGGASAVADLMDFEITRTSNTRLTLGSGQVVVGIKAFGIVADTCDINGGAAADTAYFYEQNGMFVVGVSAGTSPLTCVSWTTATSIAGFPVGSVPLWSWAATSTPGQWNATGTDFRAIAGGERSTAGVGLVDTPNNITGVISRAVDTTTTPQFVTSGSADASGNCTVGQIWIRTDTSKTWDCLTTNTWVCRLTSLTVFTKSFSLFDPVAGDSGRVQFSFGRVATILRVACATKSFTSTVTLNFDERAESTPDTAGTNVLNADLVVDTGTRTSCASGCDVNTITNGGIAANAPVALTIASVANTPTDLRCHVDYVLP